MSVMKIKILLGATTPVLKTITVLKKASSLLEADWLTWKLINHGLALMHWRWELFKELENKCVYDRVAHDIKEKHPDKSK